MLTLTRSAYQFDSLSILKYPKIPSVTDFTVSAVARPGAVLFDATRPRE